MGRLYQLLLQYQNAILFFVLQSIAFYWLFQTNNFHHASFFNASNAVVATTSKKATALTDYLKLDSINANLNNQLTILQNQRKSSYQILNDSNEINLLDTTKYARKWKSIPAKIINKTVHLTNNYITINQGEHEGIKRDMGVIFGTQVVGVIKEVSNHYSIAIPLINSQLEIGVKMKKNNQLGILKWDKSDFRTSTLINIPAYVNVEIGDTITTTGYSSYFPDNLFVGLVKSIEKNEEFATYLLNIELAIDFNNVNHVQVVTNIMKEEQKNIEEQFYN